ncbi:unnamed protein product [Caenorhabditis angaria]|uniref:Coiled-coil domain-containing protein n=1 Tax=Caenorhabditis angaria TaxID=860376 RepID=A0A9P1I462_9PELO|nr:unnamed protein product [Caenorhabditis angaria]
MPKKFATENPKVVAARDRKATAKKDEVDRKQKAADDAYWKDDDKLANRKLQRKDDDEKKRLEAIKRKEENRKLAEEEMSSLGAKKVQASPAPKITRAAIDKRKEDEERIMKELDEQRKLDAQKIEVVTEIQENLNKIDIESDSARNVEEALKILGDPKATEDDKHPEKRMRAAYLAFEEKRLPELKIKHPTYRLSQLKQVLKKEWQKSPENPLNARILALSK